MSPGNLTIGKILGNAITFVVIEKPLRKADIEATLHGLDERVTVVVANPGRIKQKLFCPDCLARD